MEVQSSHKTLSVGSCEGTCEPHMFTVGLCVLQTFECLLVICCHAQT